MDIGAISSSLSSFKLANDVGVALYSKALDNQKQMGQQLIKMIDSSGASLEQTVNGKGSVIDYRG